MISTGGTWDREGPRYFIAGDINHVVRGVGLNGPFLCDALIAVNELNSAADETKLASMIEAGCNVLIDSGCFSLANLYAVDHDINVIEALAMAPDQLPGFDALFTKYVDVVRRYGARAWGYVEIDIGGRENKIRTRARLEALGLTPIPVYHPFADGWDYFDQLAEGYDRICLANLGTATIAVRKRLVAMVWERKQKYPHLWVHALAVTPSPMFLTFPLDSCDSSSWLAGERYYQMNAWAGTQPLWPVDRGWLFQHGATTSRERTNSAYALLGYDAGMKGRAMRRMLDDQRRALSGEGA